MDAELIDDAAVVQAAATVGLELAPEHIAGTVRNFKLIAGMADVVNDFPLAPEAEHAAIFTPCSAPAPE